MKHTIVPFPVGSREGELVLRIDFEPGDGDIDLAAEIESIAQLTGRLPLSEVWVAGDAIAGTNRPVAMEMRRHWNVVIVEPITRTSWPTSPGRIVLDVSDFLRAPITHREAWTAELVERTSAIPMPSEIFAVDPHPEALTLQALHDLSQMLEAPEGCTLYLAPGDPQAIARAVAASIRAPRPWSIRQRVTAPAPAATPAG